MPSRLPPSGDDPLSLFAYLRARLQKAMVNLDAATEILETLDGVCEEWERKLALRGRSGASPFPFLGRKRPSGWRNLPLDERDKLEKLGEQGFRTLELEKFAGGRLGVRIDQGRSFELSAALADVLLALIQPVSDDPDEPEEAAPWRSRETLARMLGAKPGCVSQRLSRLRDVFWERGANPYAIRWSKRRGFRLPVGRVIWRNRA